MLSSRPRTGWKQGELAAACGLDKGTAHRLLAVLRAERLVTKSPDGKRYLPGPGLFEFGLAHHRSQLLREACREPLEQIAQAFGAFGSLWLRSGGDVVCADHVGQASTRVFVETGSRRPIATMASGVSILLTLAPGERRTLMADSRQRSEKIFPGRWPDFQRMLERSERAGYGITYGDVTPGIYSIGAPLLDAGGSARAALCLIGRTEDFPGTRIERLVRQLNRVASRISAKVPDLLVD